MTLRIPMFVQLWNSFLEELKTTKQKIIFTNVTKDLFVKKKDTKLKSQVKFLVKSRLKQSD